MLTFLLSLLRSLALTLLAEAAVVFILTRKKDFLAGSLLVNVLTNPLLNVLLVFPLHFFGMTGYVISAICGESCVVFGEAGLYHLLLRESPKKCFFVSLAANAASLGIGLLLKFL